MKGKVKVPTLGWKGRQAIKTSRNSGIFYIINEISKFNAHHSVIFFLTNKKQILDNLTFVYKYLVYTNIALCTKLRLSTRQSA